MQKIMIKSGYNYAHVTTAELPWHVQNYDLIGSLKWKLEKNEIWQDFDDKLMNRLWNKSLVPSQCT